MSPRQQRLLDKLWTLSRAYLPVCRPSPSGGRPRQDDRACFFAIVWVLFSGARWRDLPSHFPSPVTAWRRHRDWTRSGVWQKVWEEILGRLREAGKLRLMELLTDATFVAAQKGESKLA